MDGKGLLFAMPGSMLGFRLGVEFELVHEGVRVKFACTDPRDALKRAHTFETIIPSAGRIPPREAEKVEA